jgi:hypothetical protein
VIIKLGFGHTTHAPEPAINFALMPVRPNTPLLQSVNAESQSMFRRERDALE